MRAMLMLAAAAAVCVAADDKKDDKMKKYELSVGFATPNPTWKANITEARVVGKELWVKVDATTAGGIAPSVIGKAKAEATAEAADGLTVKYFVFGKTWGWKNEEKDIAFASDLDKEAVEKWEKAWKDGKTVLEVKKKDEPKKDPK